MSKKITTSLNLTLAGLDPAIIADVTRANLGLILNKLQEKPLTTPRSEVVSWVKSYLEKLNAEAIDYLVTLDVEVESPEIFKLRLDLHDLGGLRLRPLYTYKFKLASEDRSYVYIVDINNFNGEECLQVHDTLQTAINFSLETLINDFNIDLGVQVQESLNDITSAYKDWSVAEANGFYPNDGEDELNIKAKVDGDLMTWYGSATDSTENFYVKILRTKIVK